MGSRSTQFIGLTNSAEEFVSELKETKSKNKVEGMFEEEIPLRAWKTKDGLIKEVVQLEPWSSGPMIFTCLEVGDGNGGRITVFEWEHDNSINNEYSKELGKVSI